jgi:hypothetical protein
MNVDPSQDQAQDFISGLGDLVETNPSFSQDISRIFSQFSDSTILMAQLKERISRPLINSGSLQLARELRQVDHYIRFYFTSDFQNLSRIARAYFANELAGISQRQPERAKSEVPLSVILNSLGKLGDKLRQDILKFNQNGLNQYAYSLELLLYYTVNGEEKVKEFIGSIGLLDIEPTKELVTLVKNNLETVVEAVKTLKEKLLTNPEEFTQPSEKLINTTLDKIEKQYPKLFPLPHLSSKKRIESIEAFEKTVFESLQGQRFLFQRKFDEEHLDHEPERISQLREKLLKNLSNEELISLLEIPIDLRANFMENPLFNHWQELGLKQIQGRESIYLAHLRFNKIDWKHYPWHIFSTIATNAKDKDQFEAIFSEHIEDVPFEELGVLVELFYAAKNEGKLLDQALKRALLKAANTENKLHLLLLENIRTVNPGRETWNTRILDQINFRKDLEKIASFMASRPKNENTAIYLRIFDYIRKKHPELLGDLEKYLKAKFLEPQNYLSLHEWCFLETSISKWSVCHLGKFDRSFYQLACPIPHEGLKIAAFQRIQERTKLEVEGGLERGIAAKLEEEALKALVETTLKKEVEEAALILKDKLNNSTLHAAQFDLIALSIAENRSPDFINKQKIAWAEEISQQIKKLGLFPNDFLVLPIGVKGHAMQMTVLKQPEDQGKESKLVILVTNTGIGLNWHPHVDGSPTRYATTAKLGEISLATFSDPENLLALIEVMTESNSETDEEEFVESQIDKLYNVLNRICEKEEDSPLEILEFKGDLYPLKRMQYGGVCETQSVRDLTKTLLNLILFEKGSQGIETSFGDVYLESELILEQMDKWIAARYLKLSPDEFAEKSLKIDKKGASTFKAMAQPSKFTEAQKILEELFDTSIFKLSSESNKVKDLAAILKEMTKQTVIQWIKENKTLDNVKKMKDHPILKIAKLRFEYKIKAVNQAKEYIRSMETGNIEEDQINFVMRIYKELESFNTEHLILNQLTQSIDKMELGFYNSYFIRKMMDKMIEDGYTNEAVIELFYPYAKKIVEAAVSKRELSSYEFTFICSFLNLLNIEEVDGLLKPLYKTLAERPPNFGEFLLLRGILTSTKSQIIQSHIIDNILAEVAKRDASLKAKEVLFPFVLSLHLIAYENRVELQDSDKNLLEEVIKRIDEEDADYLKNILENIAKAA